MCTQHLTPELLREAATHLSESFEIDHYMDRRDPFMCNALELAGGSLEARREFQDLLYYHEVMEDGSAFCVMHEWDIPPEDNISGRGRQSVRFMLLHFLALWLESEAS